MKAYVSSQMEGLTLAMLPCFNGAFLALPPAPCAQGFILEKRIGVGDGSKIFTGNGFSSWIRYVHIYIYNHVYRDMHPPNP